MTILIATAREGRLARRVVFFLKGEGEEEDDDEHEERGLRLCCGGGGGRRRWGRFVGRRIQEWDGFDSLSWT